MKISITLCFFSLFLICCTTKKPLLLNNIKKDFHLTVSNSKEKNWQVKDITLDTVPGISLKRAYKELIGQKKGKEIIIAVIDSQLDTNHENLKKSIWLNRGEIPNNNIDDDRNGYVDDVNGWNFISNSKGESTFRVNFEYVRIIKKYKSRFENFTIKTIPIEEKEIFKTYQKALVIFNENLEIRKNNLKKFNAWKKKYDATKKALSKYFPEEKYTFEKLKKIKTDDKNILSQVKKMMSHIEYHQNDEWLKRKTKLQENYLNYYLNINYNDRKIIGDDPNDINDTKYGFNNVAINKEKLTYHATYIAGLLVARNIDSNVTSNNIKIMPIVISPNGDEYDKDIALAIKYAVDNGAKVINMSSEKGFSLNKTWVIEALKYAEKNNVLFVNCAGNDASNIDIIHSYPNDIDKNGNEVLTNFIKVGSSSNYLDKNILSYFSNYGKQNVDLFAPGENIYTTKVNNTYRFVDGTSYSTPIVSRVAALILSYYPNLKAHQVKDILLTSGVSYDIDVEITDENGKKKLVPFSSLSKSGKILNAYNALLYAENYKKWKKGKWSKK